VDSSEDDIAPTKPSKKAAAKTTPTKKSKKSKERPDLSAPGGWAAEVEDRDA
jgi:hypothetical protein